MKKLIALLMALCLAMTAVCAFAEENAALERAKKQVYNTYKSSERGVPVTTSKDYEVWSQVRVGEEYFPIVWTVDTDKVTVVVGEDGKVTVNVDEKSPEEVPYVLTATISDGSATETVSFDRLVPVSMSLFGLTEQEIVAKAFRLQNGETLPSATVLTGVITKAEEFSEKYGNINVYFIPADMGEEYEMEAYRLSGEGADKLAVGDTITVAGKVKNYNGTIEFDSGCKLIPADAAAAVRTVYDAYTLEKGEAMEAPATLTGVISEIVTAYSADYKNITVNMVVQGQDAYPIQCYRLSGEGADTLAVGDTITVTGTIKNYTNSSGVVTIEFDSGCTLDAVAKAE